MRRMLVTLLTVFAAAVLVPTIALARAPSTTAFAYEGTFGDVVGGGSVDGIWNKPDGATDTVFSLQLAPVTTKDLVALKIDDGDGNYWDTYDGLGWAVGVTAARTTAKHLLNPDELYTKNLDRGLAVYLRIRLDAGMLQSGETFALIVYYDDGSQTTLTDTVP